MFVPVSLLQLLPISPENNQNNSVTDISPFTADFTVLYGIISQILIYLRIPLRRVYACMNIGPVQTLIQPP